MCDRCSGIFFALLLYGVLSSQLWIGCSASQSVNFTVVSFPPCVPAFTVKRVALLYGVPEQRISVISSSACNVSFRFVDLYGSQQSAFVSAAALDYYFSVLEQYALENFTLIQARSFVGPTPEQPQPLPSGIPTPIPVSSPLLVATFPSAVACASFQGKLAAFLQVQPSRIIFQRSPSDACPSQAMLQFSFAKRSGSDFVSVADMVFALLEYTRSQDSTLLESVLGTTSLTMPSSTVLPDSSQFAVGNSSTTVFTVFSSSYKSIGAFLQNNLSASSSSLLWMTQDNETTFASSDATFLSCVFPDAGSTSSAVQGSHFPLFWICCGLTVVGFIATCVIVSKRPRESTLSSAETLRDLEERLKKNSPMKERVVEEKLTILHDSEVRARHDFDMN